MKTLGEVQKAVRVAKDHYNEFGKYSFRTAEGILAAAKSVLPPDAAITCSDTMQVVGDRIFVTATARLIIDGQTYEAQGHAMHAMQKKGMDDAQITGSCSSYARKYALGGLLAIDDGSVDPDSRDNRDEGKSNATSEGLRNAWLDGVMDSLPADATSEQKANAIASQMIEDINAYKSEKGVDGYLDKQRKYLTALHEKHNDLYGFVMDAVMMKRDELKK
jgi:hypothetical protein